MLESETVLWNDVKSCGAMECLSCTPPFLLIAVTDLLMTTLSLSRFSLVFLGFLYSFKITLMT